MAQYRPRHRSQLQRPVTGQWDCGPRTLQHAIDFATRGNRDVGIQRVRELMGRPGPQPTNIYNSDEAMSRLGLAYVRHTGQEWSVLTDALRSGKGLQICVSYGVVNDIQPARSGDRGFRGGHSIYIQELRRRKSDHRWVTLSFDSLFDGRRSEVPKGPKWTLMSTYRRACQAFAGRRDLFWGGVVPPSRRVSGPGDEAETDPELDEVFPIDPDAHPESGDTFPIGSTGEDLGGIDDDDDEDVDDDEEVE